MSTHRIAASLVGLVTALALTSRANAQPTVTTYQGRLTSAGAPANGSFDFVFRLCSSAGPGGVLQAFPAAGTIAVNVTDGLFTQELTFNTTHFSGADRWLELEVEGTTLSPRQLLTHTPYAIIALSATTAGNAAQLNGQAAAFYQNATSINSGTLPDARLSANIPRLNAANGFGNFTNSFAGNVGIGTSAPARRLHVENGSAGAIAPHSNTSMVLERSGNNYVQMYAPDGNESGLLFGKPSLNIRAAILADAGDSLQFRTGGNVTRMILDGAGNLGIGTATPSCALDVQTADPVGILGGSTATTGASYGGRFESASTLGRGVFGSATAATGITYGGYFESASSAGRGVFGSGAVGGRFESDTTTGQGVFGGATAATGTNYGGRFETDSTSGRGVFGWATAATGTNYGVRGESASTGGFGVHGSATATSGVTTGVYGRSSSATGGSKGVHGEASADSGTTYGVYGVSNGSNGRGVQGFASGTGGTLYGVAGSNAGSGGYAVYAFGDTGASGTKSFRIDHPDDPENKYLLHYAAESPEVINFYRGTAVLDRSGGATVELPHYFAKINKTPSYQLTAVGTPMPMLHIAREIDESILSAGANAGPGEAAPVCSFRIAGGAPGAQVSWEVKAVRNDRWVQQRGAPVEVEKQDLEHGVYQHPKLYGQPPAKGMNYDDRRDRIPSPPDSDAAPD